MKIKKGDTVKVLYGKDSGRQGVVVVVDPNRNSVIVEGINMYKKHVKGDGRSKTSEILTIAKPLNVSKVMLICPSCGKPTRITIKRGKKKVERVCKKCGKSIEMEEKEVQKEEEKKPKKRTTTKKTTKKKATKSKSKAKK